MGAANLTELRVQRRLIRAFNKAEAATITLMRPTMIKTAAGGLKKGTATPQAPLTCRLVPFKRRLVKMTRDTPDGQIINLEYVLVAEYNADVKPGDFFEYNNGWYDVFSLEPNTAHRVAANITYRGAQVDDTWGT